MILSWLVATLHLLALPLGLGGVWIRARALSGTPDPGALRRAFAADTVWGVAAVLWILTGAWRAFGGLEKGATYYLAQPMFHLKLGLVVVIVLLELWPMATLIRWRLERKRGEPVDTTAARLIALISRAQAVMVVTIVFAAAALARGMFGR